MEATFQTKDRQKKILLASLEKRARECMQAIEHRLRGFVDSEVSRE